MEHEIKFVAADVCATLGYANSRQAVQKNCKTGGVSIRDTIDNLGRTQSLTYINEGNLYRLIVKSRKPEAEKFEMTLDSSAASAYNARVIPKQGVMRFCSLRQFAAKSRNRTVCGFFIGTSYGGADGRAQALPVFAPRVARSANLSALPPNFAVGRQLFNATLEAIMADLFTSKPAQSVPFNFGTHAVRVIMRDGNPWFVAADVCATLGYKNTSDAVATHLDDDERSTIANGESRNGGGQLVIINESGLYALVLRSHKPEAEKFEMTLDSSAISAYNAPVLQKTGRGISLPNGAAKSRYTQCKRLFSCLGGPVYGRPGEWSRKARRCSIGRLTLALVAHPISLGLAVSNR